MSILQQKSGSSILELLNKVSKSTKIVSLFDSKNEKTPQLTRQGLDLHKLNTQENCEKKLSWHNADEIMSKLKSSHVKPIQPTTK
jgi:hypothetical protein